MTTNKIKNKVADCTFSLAMAIQEAGGSLNEDVLDMSVRDFISQYGQNNIRFCFEKPDDDN